MKILAIIFLALVGTFVLNGPIQSYADPQLDALLKIATQARDNLKMNISQINNVPDEITHLFKQGSYETDALSNAIDKKDIVSARQHFLSAMNFFKATNDKVSSLNVAHDNNAQQIDTLQLKGEIRRLESVAKTLKTVALTNNINFDFTPFDNFIRQASQDIDAGKINEASKLIDQANSIVLDAHHSITEVANQKNSERAKDFTAKQIEKLNRVGNETAQNSIPQAPKVSTMAKTSTNFTSNENPKDMASKLKKLASEGKVDEALKVIKTFNAHQKQK